MRPGYDTANMPYALAMENGEYAVELPGGGCAGSCSACFCPCIVFGKLVEKMRANRGGMDWTACGSWLLCVLALWGGVSALTQMLMHQVDSQEFKYMFYAFYILYYIGYMFPYLQALYMYKSLKGLMMVAGGQSLQAGQTPVAVTVPCSQFCTFLLCPCIYLNRARAFVDLENDSNNSTFIHLEETIVCPLTLYNSYRMKVKQGGRAGDAPHASVTNSDALYTGLPPPQPQYAPPHQLATPYRTRLLATAAAVLIIFIARISNKENGMIKIQQHERVRDLFIAIREEKSKCKSHYVCAS